MCKGWWTPFGAAEANWAADEWVVHDALAIAKTHVFAYALAACAIELIHMLGLLKFLGYEHEGPVEVETDNKGATSARTRRRGTARPSSRCSSSHESS